MIRTVLILVTLAACAEPTIFVGRSQPPGQSARPLSDPCVRTGCRGELCAEGEVSSTCADHASDLCYAVAACKKQADGGCGFTIDEALTECLAEQPTICEEEGHACLPLVAASCRDGEWLDLKAHSCSDRLGLGCCKRTRALSGCERGGGTCVTPNSSECAHGLWLEGAENACADAALACCGRLP